MSEYKYFKDAEFRKCSPSCSIDDMDEGFIRLLDGIRGVAGIPLVLNSAYRSPEHEKKMGRSGTSSHCKGIAVDIRCNTLANRDRIVRAAMACGITRFGIAPTYIHIDADKDKTQGVIWIYDKAGNQL